MVFPKNFHTPTYFDAFYPHSLGKANQQIRPFCKNGASLDGCVDAINQTLSGAKLGQGFSNQMGPGPVIPTPVTPVVVQKSLVPEILTIVAIALVAGILAYTRPDLFASLFKLFIGYEIFSLIVGVVLILIILAIFVSGMHKN